MLLKNLELKIISVILALLLWFSVATSDYREATFDVPIILENLNKGLIAVYDTNIIRVTLKGPNYVLKSISFDDVKVVINSSLLKYGKNKYVISLSDVKTPEGVEVVKVEPKIINVTIDQLVKRKVKVIPIFIGTPKVGFKLKKYVIYPKIVEIEGAKKSIGDKKTIETLPIDITNKYQDITYNIAVKKETGIMKINPAYVEVFITFSEDYGVKTVQMPIDVESENEKVKILNKVAKVKLKVRKDFANEEMIFQNLRLFVDVSDLVKKGRYLRQIKYEVKTDKIKVLKISPQKIRVEVME